MNKRQIKKEERKAFWKLVWAKIKAWFIPKAKALAKQLANEAVKEASQVLADLRQQLHDLVLNEVKTFDGKKKH